MQEQHYIMCKLHVFTGKMCPDVVVVTGKVCPDVVVRTGKMCPDVVDQYEKVTGPIPEFCVPPFRIGKCWLMVTLTETFWTSLSRNS